MISLDRNGVITAKHSTIFSLGAVIKDLGLIKPVVLSMMNTLRHRSSSSLWLITELVIYFPMDIFAPFYSILFSLLTNFLDPECHLFTAGSKCDCHFGND